MTQGYDPAWADGGLVVVLIFLGLIAIGTLIKFWQDHKPLIVVFLLTAAVAGVFFILSGGKIR